MPTKAKTKKCTTAPVKELLHDGSQEFELLVQKLLSEITITQDLVKLRRDLGLSQADVAEITGLRQPHVAKLESGNFKNFEIKTLLRVAAALGKTVKLSLVPDDRLDRPARPTRPHKAPKASTRVAHQT